MNTSNQDAVNDKSTPRTIAMYSDQWAVVEEINDRYDFRNLSTAMRFIINDYRRLRSDTTESSTTTAAGATTAP